MEKTAPKPKMVVNTAITGDSEEAQEERRKIADYLYNPTEEMLLQLSIIPASEIIRIAIRVTLTPQIINDTERPPGSLPKIFTMNLLRLFRSRGGALMRMANDHTTTEMAGIMEDGGDPYGD